MKNVMHGTLLIAIVVTILLLAWHFLGPRVVMYTILFSVLHQLIRNRK